MREVTPMVEDLREKFMQKTEEIEREEQAKAQRPLLGLEPWQRLVLALLAFLDVAVIGLLMLVMSGRIRWPF
jgi:hypothetical protein